MSITAENKLNSPLSYATDNKLASGINANKLSLTDQTERITFLEMQHRADVATVRQLQARLAELERTARRQREIEQHLMAE